MKTSALRHLLCVVLALVIWTDAFAQLGLGPRRLIDAEAPTLDEPDHLDIGLRKPGYVGRVGGVAFDKVASPVEDLTFKSLSLNYHSDSVDGHRLWVTVDGQNFSSPIYDWQLIPIAKFADSRYYACVTLFGKLFDTERQKRVKQRGGRVINYHPAFINTLLGLRLFQLDILIVEPESIYLPKNGVNYILGKGESKPNIKANSIGRNKYFNYKKRNKAGLREEYSYVICDHDRDIRFDFRGGSLTITGEPFFYFWWYKDGEPGYDRVAAVSAISNEIKIRIDSERMRNPDTFNEKEWYVNALVEQIHEYEQGHTFHSNSLINELMKAQGVEVRKVFLRKYSVSVLREALLRLRAVMAFEAVIPFKEYSEQLSGQPQMLRAINPAVWDAGVNVMRYAAFFRYCKQNHPKEWQIFIDQINKAPAISPQVRTPSILEK